MKIAVGDLEIGYDRQGEGEPVLLIMGAMSSGIWWPENFTIDLLPAWHVRLFC
jgi:pimeloyl-ACP methyl ester carboxylesterase